MVMFGWWIGRQMLIMVAVVLNGSNSHISGNSTNGSSGSCWCIFLIDVVYTCLGGNLGCCCLRCCGSWEGRL